MLVLNLQILFLISMVIIIGTSFTLYVCMIFCCMLCVVTVPDEIATGVLISAWCVDQGLSQDLEFFLQHIFRSY